ncbi:MAG: hypothetical protein IJ667_05475 [Synergistaceae bacterium]|nr:hypothetical protein [Synergistaceae bacterium]
MTEAASVIDNRQTAIFELQVKNLREHVDAHERINDAKFDRIEALMAKNFFEQEAMINELRSEFKDMNSRMSRMEGDINRLKDNINNIKSNITGLKVEINEVKGDIKVINAKSALQSRLTRDATCIGIILGIALAVIQHFLK